MTTADEAVALIKAWPPVRSAAEQLADDFGRVARWARADARRLRDEPDE